MFVHTVPFVSQNLDVGKTFPACRAYCLEFDERYFLTVIFLVNEESSSRSNRMIVHPVPFMPRNLDVVYFLDMLSYGHRLSLEECYFFKVQFLLKLKSNTVELNICPLGTLSVAESHVGYVLSMPSFASDLMESTYSLSARRLHN
jgi:hypothetical protein